MTEGGSKLADWKMVTNAHQRSPAREVLAPSARRPGGGLPVEWEVEWAGTFGYFHLITRRLSGLIS